MFELYLEDCDLLDNMFITNQINESYLDTLYASITEQEMMIALYETQQFMVEQDTEIFMYLKYGFVNESFIHEGVLEKIGKAIISVLEKIKELISRFIAFITGNRKKESNSGTNNIKLDNVESSNKTIQKTEEIINKNEKSLNSIKPNNQDSIDKIKKLEEQLQDIRNELHEINYGERYKYINNLFQRTDFILSLDNDITVSSKINDLFDAGFEIARALKRDMTKFNYLNNNLYYFCKLNYLSKTAKILDEYDGKISVNYTFYDDVKNKVIDSHSQFTDTKQFMTREAYLREYKIHKPYFEKYSGNTSNYLKSLNDDLRNKITPLRKELTDITLADYNSAKPTDQRLIKLLVEIINRLSAIYNDRIKILNHVENLYYRYKYNCKLLMTDGKRINELSIQAQKIKQQIVKLEYENIVPKYKL